MRSNRPKPLHLICGRPMVMHVIHALEDVAPDRTVVVVGHGAERVTKKVQEQAPLWANVTFVEQTVQRGTGDAAMVGLDGLPGDDLDDTSTILVLPGDTPLLQPGSLDLLVADHVANQYAAMLLEKTVVDRVQAAPEFVQMFPSSELIPSAKSPGVSPSYQHQRVEHGRVVT